MKKETLITISERTGFSVSTVSRVLGGKANKYRISDKTINVISEEARKCNYTPSLLAKGLRTSKTNTIGLLVPGIENPYFANIASIVISEARKIGYTIVLVDTMESEKNEQEGIESLLARMVDGMIVVPSGSNPEFLESVDRRTPVVLIDRHFEPTTLSYVTTNNYEGGFEATKYLIDFGHRDILCVCGVHHSMPARERERGYLEALRQNGLENMTRVAGNDFTIQNGYLETKLALNGLRPPTAIFAMSNTILLGAIKAIRESSLRIPDDISIVSFDNYTYLDYLDPAITRVGQRINEMGMLAIKLLQQRIEGDGNGMAKIQLIPQLIVCNSVSLRQIHVTTI
jgi:LacI family transcriptional regulator